MPYTTTLCSVSFTPQHFTMLYIVSVLVSLRFFFHSCQPFSYLLLYVDEKLESQFLLFRIFLLIKNTIKYYHCISFFMHTMYLLRKIELKIKLLTIFHELFFASIDEYTIFSYYLMWLDFGWIRMFPFRIWQLPYSSTLFFSSCYSMTHHAFFSIDLYYRQNALNVIEFME